MNQVYIRGVIETDFIYSHSIDGKKFYKNYVRSVRLSETIDRIPIIVPENLLKNMLGR